MNFDASHLAGASIIASVLGALGGPKLISMTMRLWTGGKDRDAKLEEKRISAETNVKVAEIEAEAQRDVAEITGQHQVLDAQQSLIETLLKRLDKCEERHTKTNEKLENLQAQIRGWENTESAREVTFQAVLTRATECEAAREVDRKRLNALDQEMRDLRARISA